MDRAFQRTKILTNHLLQSSPSSPAQIPSLSSNACLDYSPPELSEGYAFDIKEMRQLLDGHHVADRDWLFGMMMQSKLFNPRVRGGKVFVSPDYNQSMEQQREMTWKRIVYLLERGVFKGWLTEKGEEAEMRKFAYFEAVGLFDHSIAIKLGVHFFLWCVIRFSFLFKSVGFWLCCFILLLKMYNFTFWLSICDGFGWKWR